ncbi:Solute carrier family 22 member 13 [Holothuria leucospilota]|uniref:Solute carrier family 22 member 13 n=1 Tax=Holothuria leucospilota TaxID=206669 RepID=A0A9Q1BTJ2_HOLLE|nr:Solute carrier family 22 member 13 [Holothuria leucospilota]
MHSVKNTLIRSLGQTHDHVRTASYSTLRRLVTRLCRTIARCHATAEDWYPVRTFPILVSCLEGHLRLWELVCNRDFLPDLSQSLLMVGFAVGSLVGGPLADKYGRRPTILICLILFNVIGLSVSLVQSFAAFVTLRFLMGALFKGIRIPLINMLFESLVPRHRPLIGSIPNCFYPLGLMMMAGLAYLVRDWRKLNVILLVPSILILPFFWLIPESARWLLSQGKTEEAERTMQKIASMNNAKGFPSPVFAQEYENGTGMLTSPSQEDHTPNSVSSKEQVRGTKAFTQLLKQPTITVTLVLSWNTITDALTFFGFALTTGTLAGDPYLNFFISSMADLFELTIAVFLIKRIGSLITLISGIFGAALAMIGIIILPYVTGNTVLLGSLLTVLAVFGRFCISLGWQPLVLLTSDLFPTSVRNSGTAIVHLFGNFGSLASPLVIYLNKYYKNLSFMIMVIFCVLSVVFSLLLPETSNTTQPETLEDLRILFDTKRLVRFRRKNRKNHSSKAEEFEMKSSDGTGPGE